MQTDFTSLYVALSTTTPTPTTTATTAVRDASYEGNTGALHQDDIDSLHSLFPRSDTEDSNDFNDDTPGLMEQAAQPRNATPYSNCWDGIPDFLRPNQIQGICDPTMPVDAHGPRANSTSVSKSNSAGMNVILLLFNLLKC